MTDAPVDSPKVSVCIRTYNHASYVAQAIESSLCQETDFSFEILIADDRSDDGTRRIVRQYQRAHPDVIRPMLHEQHIGGRANFIAAHQACRGQYVAILDGDDYWTSPLKLQAQADALDANSHWSLCFHQSRVILEQPSSRSVLFPARMPRRVSSLRHITVRQFIPSNSVMYRNGLLDDYWDFIATVPRPADWAVYILLAHHGRIGYVDGVLSETRVDRGGAWSRLSADEQSAQSVKMLRAMLPVLGSVERQRIRSTILRYRLRSRVLPIATRWGLRGGARRSATAR